MRSRKLCTLLVLWATCASPQLSLGQDSAKPFSLGAETNVINNGDSGGYPAYPSYPVYQPPVQHPPPHLTQQKPKAAPVHHEKPLQANIQQNSAPPPMQAAVQEERLPPGVLPQQFIGQWSVLGSRTKAQGGGPQYQEALDRVMPQSNNQSWNIAGQPGAYSMTSSNGASNIQVNQCTTNTAFIRHQYQVGNCVAREAYVLQLDPSGTSFQGVMRCSVSKPGEPPPPRFQAQYNLMGRRRG